MANIGEQRIRVKLRSFDSRLLDQSAAKIVVTTKRSGANVAGPIPLPTKKLKVVTRKAVSGDGSETFDRWEMRVHKRVVDVGMNERALHHIMRIEVPDEVNIEIELRE